MPGEQIGHLVMLSCNFVESCGCCSQEVGHLLGVWLDLPIRGVRVISPIDVTDEYLVVNQKMGMVLMIEAARASPAASA